MYNILVHHGIQTRQIVIVTWKVPHPHLRRDQAKEVYLSEKGSQHEEDFLVMRMRVQKAVMMIPKGKNLISSRWKLAAADIDFQNFIWDIIYR